MFLGWGGVYSDAKEDAAQIRDCFSRVDEIIPAAQRANGNNFDLFHRSLGNAAENGDLFEKLPTPLQGGRPVYSNIQAGRRQELIEPNFVGTRNLKDDACGRYVL